MFLSLFCATDWDECTPLGCDLNSQCITHQNGAVCECQAGFIMEDQLCH
ncbi:hypothetical protein E2320_007609, partial [Naja naja]